MKRTAEETLQKLIILTQESLEEINDSNSNPFLFGEKHAYIECLEIAQEWEKAEMYGLDYDIEKRFPIT